MPIETQRIENLPAVLATFTAYITVADIEQMYQDTEQLLADAGEKYYRISDVTLAETSFPDFIKITTTMTSQGKFRTGDPNMQVIFIGTNQWMYNIRNLAQQKGIKMPTFFTLEEALEFIRLDMSGYFKNQAS